MSSIEGRKSNFELLRIFSMVLIILYHLVLYGCGRVADSYSLSNIIYSFFSCGGKLGVALFIMITGYFMIDKDKDINIKKMVRLEGQVLFYSFLSFLIYKIFTFGEITGQDYAKIFFPNLVGTYWFFSSYFVLCFLVPYINRAVKLLSEIEFRKLLIIGFVFFILIPSLVIYKEAYSEGIYLVYYYLVGAYIRLFLDNKVILKRYLILGSVFGYGMIMLLFLILSNLAFSNPILYDLVLSFSDLKSIFVFVVAICLFLLFKQLNIKNSKIINLLASLSFGIYLFHDNFLLRDILWIKIFNVNNYYNSKLFLLYGIGIVILIYFIGGIIEYIRKKIFDDKLFSGVCDRVCLLFKLGKK